MNCEENEKIPWSKIIIGIIIFTLFMLWVDQRNENEQAKEEFAMQTARAENQKAVSIAATKEIESKIMNCIGTDEVARYFGSNQCVVGFISHIQEITEPNPSTFEPGFYFTYFGFMPNTFYLYGPESLWSYVGKCVMVWGGIRVDNAGTPALLVIENEYGEVNIEKLPDDACRR